MPKEKLYTVESYIKAVRAVHGDKFDYSKTVYTRLKKHVTIICRKHGEFTRQACTMLIGKAGCPTCSLISKESKTMPADEYIERATARFSGRFTYIDVPDTVRHNSLIQVICKEHGRFNQRAGAHLHILAHGCPQCANNARSNSVRKYKATVPNVRSIAELKEVNQTLSGVTDVKPVKSKQSKQDAPDPSLYEVEAVSRFSNLKYPSDIDRSKLLNMFNRKVQ